MQADRGRRRLGLGRMAQQEDRPPGRLGPAVETAGGGQVKTGGIAAQFEEHGPHGAGGYRFLGHPQRTGQRAGRGDDEVRQAGERGDARRMRQTRLGQHIGGGDPQQRTGRIGCEARQRQGKTRRCAGLARFAGAQFAQRGERQATAKGGIEGGKAGRDPFRCPASTGEVAQGNVLGPKRLGRPLLNGADGPAQGAKPL